MKFISHMGNFEAKEISTGKEYLNGQREKKQFLKPRLNLIKTKEICTKYFVEVWITEFTRICSICNCKDRPDFVETKNNFDAADHILSCISA